MKNKLMSILVFYFLLIFGFSICYAQSAPDILWTKTFGGDNGERAYSVQQTSDGGFIVAGYTSSYGSGCTDVWLVKTDENGSEEWNQTYGGTDDDCAYDVRQTGDGGFIIVGYSDSFGPGYHNVYLIKTDEQGNEEWYRTFGNYDNRGNAVQQTNDGGYIIAGATWIYERDDYFDAWLIKTDENGYEEWSKTYGGYEWDEAHSVQQTNDGGYILGGYSVYDFLLIKTDEVGNTEWSQTYGGGAIDIGYSAQQTNDGGYIIIGYTYSFGDDMQYWLIKTDEMGNEEWNQTYGGVGEDWAFDVKQASDGGYILVGNTNSYWESDLWIIKTDEQGNEVWNKMYGNNDLETGYSIEQTTDSGYIIAGEKTFIETGWSDFLLVRVDSDSVVSVDDTIIENPVSNYPNPFNTSTSINYHLPQNIREATIEIYNIKGQLTEKLQVNNFQSSIEWNAEGLASGIYFLRLSTDTDKIAKKMILLR